MSSHVENNNSGVLNGISYTHPEGSTLVVDEVVASLKNHGSIANAEDAIFTRIIEKRAKDDKR